MRKSKKIFWSFALTIGILMQIAMFYGVVSADSGTPWNGTSANSFAVGDGSENNPYQISTPEELSYMRDKVNDGTFVNKHFILTNDIDLNNLPWTPIGLCSTGQPGYGNPDDNATLNGANFTGVFDGNGKIISNFKVQNNDQWDYLANGLFGLVGVDGASGVSATIKHLGLEGTMIKPYRMSGSIAAAVLNAVIEECYSSVDITDVWKWGGGIAGYMKGEHSVIRNCYYTGTIQTGDCEFTAGIVGVTYGSKIENCYNAGNIIGSRFKTAGIVGDPKTGSPKTIVDGCFNMGDIKGQGDIGPIYGGGGLANSQAQIKGGVLTSMSLIVDNESKVVSNIPFLDMFVNFYSKTELETKTPYTTASWLFEDEGGPWVINAGSYPTLAVFQETTPSVLSLDYNNGIVTVTGDVPSDAKIIIASYAENKRLVYADIIDYNDSAVVNGVWNTGISDEGSYVKVMLWNANMTPLLNAKKIPDNN